MPCWYPRPSNSQHSAWYQARRLDQCPACANRCRPHAAQQEGRGWPGLRGNQARQRHCHRQAGDRQRDDAEHAFARAVACTTPPPVIQTRRTVNHDMANGNAADETFDANRDNGIQTQQSEDVIDGGDGTDTLVVDFDSSTAVIPTLRNIEVVNVTATGSSAFIDLGAATSVTRAGLVSGTRSPLPGRCARRSGAVVWGRPRHAVHPECQSPLRSIECHAAFWTALPHREAYCCAASVRPTRWRSPGETGCFLVVTGTNTI